MQCLRQLKLRSFLLVKLNWIRCAIAAQELTELFTPSSADLKNFSQQQLKASNEAIENFVKGAALWGILLAQMQSGKTDTYLRIACELLDKNLVDFVVIFSGNSETDLCDQVYENVKEEQRNVKNPVAKSSSFWPKYLSSKEESLASVPQQFRSFALEGMKSTNKAKISIVWGTELNNYSGPTERTLFIWDEAHFAQNITQRPDKFLKKIGISANGDSSLLKQKQNMVLSVSATPFSELSDIHHMNQAKFVIKMEPGETYVSVKQIRDSKRLIGYSNIETGLRTAFSLSNPAEGPQWAVIRISKKSEDLVKDLCMVNGWRFVVYDSISKEKDEGKKAWDSMAKPPKCNTAILIRGMCRMGKNMQKKHLSFVFETAKKSSTDTVLQGLLGRCCGYSEGSSKVYAFVSQKIIDSNEINRYIELWDNDGVQIMPSKANNLINNDIKFKEFYTGIYDTLKVHKENGYLDLQEKVKTRDLDFLNNLKLFNISFCDFKDEKKNTKRTLVNYLNEFYIISNFLKLSQGGNCTESLFNEITTIVKGLIKPTTNESESNTVLTKSNIKGKEKQLNSILDNLDTINTEDLSSATGINFSSFDNLLKNKEIMNIATELTNEMENLQIDPMSIMSSLMTGNLNDNKIGSLISSIGTKLTNKIDSGAINKKELEEQAKMFMTDISSNKDLMSFANNLGNSNGKM
ncbi:MAG: hypothetical protein EBX50_16565 [Chitinophagia bacterium]|nr:hypothetical protein [Chitinophagia bacterium]